MQEDVQTLQDNILDWAHEYKNTELHGVYEKALDLKECIKKHPEQLREWQLEFAHLQRVEPLRERIELYAQGMSGVGEEMQKYETMKRDYEDSVSSSSTMSPLARALMEKQLALFQAQLMNDNSLTHRRNRYGRVDNAFQDDKRMQEFEQVKAFIAALNVRGGGVDPLDIQDRFESWQRKHRRQKYSGYSGNNNKLNRRYLGTGSAYVRAFDAGYKKRL